jgi:hypothetical protein
MKPLTFFALCCLVAGIGLYEPVHTFLRLHKEAVTWFAIGTWVQWAIVDRPDRWLRDRVLWLRWFSL